MITATIANGAIVSDTIDGAGEHIAVIITPSAIATGTIYLGFDVFDGTTWSRLYDATGAMEVVTYANSKAFYVNTDHFRGVGRCRLVSLDTSKADKAQDATRTFYIMTSRG